MKIIKDKQSARGVVSSFSRDALEEFAPAPRIEIDGLQSEVEVHPAREEYSSRDWEQLREEVLAQAAAEADAIREQAQQEGYDAGFAAGQEAFRAETATALEGHQQALERIEAHYDAFLSHTTPELCALIAHMARSILQREAATDPELIVRIVDKGLRQIGEAPSVTIHLHPDDRNALSELLEQAPDTHPGIGEIHFVGNAEITRGGAILDTPELHLDSRIEQLIEEFVQALGG